MHELGKVSMERLRTCDRRLQRIATEAIRITPIDFTILEGYRTIPRQQALFRQGASKIDGINKVGKHNYSPSLAMDIAPYPIDWQDLRRFYLLAGTILSVANSQGVALRWGGDWNSNGNFDDQSFHDLPHFELRDM